MNRLEAVAAYLNRDGWRTRIETFGTDHVLKIFHPLMPDQSDRIYWVEGRGYWWLFGTFISRDPERTARHVQTVIGRVRRH